MTKEDRDAILGKQATDTITGFKGTVTGIAFYYTGCTQYLLEGKSHNGGKREVMWSDDTRVLFADETAVVSGKNGGPQHNAPIR